MFDKLIERVSRTYSAEAATRLFQGSRAVTDVTTYSSTTTGEVATAVSSGQDTRGSSRKAKYERRTFEPLFSRRRT